MLFFFFNDTATTEIYTYLHTLSLHDALPISSDIAKLSECIQRLSQLVTDFKEIKELDMNPVLVMEKGKGCKILRSEEHTSELQSLMRISYAVFCLKKKIKTLNIPINMSPYCTCIK